MTRVLVIGYGNVLRTDDGIGRHAAEALAEGGRLQGAVIQSVHQLTPELALDVSDADLVVLVDADEGTAPGTIATRRVERGGPRQAWSHQLDPSGLADLAFELYGSEPALFVLGVGVASIEVGEGLSPPVEAALPAVLDAIVALVRGVAVSGGA